MNLSVIEVITLAFMSYFIFLGVFVGVLCMDDMTNVLYWPSLVLSWAYERVSNGYYYLSNLNKPYTEAEIYE